MKFLIKYIRLIYFIYLVGILLIFLYVFSTSAVDDNQESDEESVADILIQKLPEIDATAVKKKT